MLIVVGGATYLMLWPKDGKMYKVSCGEMPEQISVNSDTNYEKEDIRGIYDGSLFHTWAAQVEKKKQKLH